MLASIWSHIIELGQTIADASVILWGVLASFTCSTLATFTASFKSGSMFNWLRKLINVVGLNFGKASSADDEHHQKKLDEKEEGRKRFQDLSIEHALTIANLKAELEKVRTEANKTIEQSRQNFAKQFNEEVGKLNDKIRGEHGKLLNQVRTLKAANTRLKADKNALEASLRDKIRAEVHKVADEAKKAASGLKKLGEKVIGKGKEKQDE